MPRLLLSIPPGQSKPHIFPVWAHPVSRSPSGEGCFPGTDRELRGRLSGHACSLGTWEGTRVRLSRKESKGLIVKVRGSGQFFKLHALGDIEVNERLPSARNENSDSFRKKNQKKLRAFKYMHIQKGSVLLCLAWWG